MSCAICEKRKEKRKYDRETGKRPHIGPPASTDLIAVPYCSSSLGDPMKAWLFPAASEKKQVTSDMMRSRG